MLKPMLHDSGLAVAVSALLAPERNRNALVLVLAADHVVRKFRAALRALAGADATQSRSGRSQFVNSTPDGLRPVDDGEGNSPRSLSKPQIAVQIQVLRKRSANSAFELGSA